MPVLPRRRHEIGQAVQKLNRRELDDAIGPGCVDFRERPGPTRRSRFAGSTPSRLAVSRTPPSSPPRRRDRRLHIPPRLILFRGIPIHRPG
jgi:hypothetical protein